MEDMKQGEFPWAASDVRRDAPDVVLDPATTTAVIALLTRALLVVVRAIEETDHER